MPFRWMPGMLDHQERRVLVARTVSRPWYLDVWDPRAGHEVLLTEGPDRKWTEHWYDEATEQSHTRPTEEPRPDLNDSATRGCLLDQVRESPGNRTAFVLPPGALGTTWKILKSANSSPLDSLHPIAEGPSEGESLWNAVQSLTG